MHMHISIRMGVMRPPGAFDRIVSEHLIMMAFMISQQLCKGEELMSRTGQGVFTDETWESYTDRVQYVRRVLSGLRVLSGRIHRLTRRHQHYTHQAS